MKIKFIKNHPFGIEQGKEFDTEGAKKVPLKWAKKQVKEGFAEEVKAAPTKSKEVAPK